MAVSEIDTSECNSDSSVDNTKPGDRKDKLFTKVVVRRLPPSMNKESFLNQVSPLPDYDYMYFVKADMSLGEFALSRAYINFKNPNDIFIFKEKFDNYVFVDAKGNEYVAVVEFAPFCRIAKKRNKNKNDPKCATIETDPIYLEFVESLNQVNTAESEEKPEYCFQPTADDDKKVTNTPLLDFIKQRRIDRQKIKEEKREERKRRELERKRMKEEERKGRKRIEHVSHSANVIKSSSSHSKTSNAQLDAIEENKSETSVKVIKEKKYDDYRGKGGKVGGKEYTSGDKRPTYASSKDTHRSVDQKKSPSKIRQRNQHISDKEPRTRTEYKSKRDDMSSSHKGKKDDKDEKIVEKKVKKYSERREERKNEFKKQECKSENIGETCKEKTKSTDHKSNEHKQSEKSEHCDEKRSSKEKDEAKYLNDFDKVSDSSKEDSRSYRENDPRTQRRIRNKDRPTMAIYQPGMGLGRNRKGGNTEGSEDGQKSSAGSDTNKSQ